MTRGTRRTRRAVRTTWLAVLALALIAAAGVWAYLPRFLRTGSLRVMARG